MKHFLLIAYLVFSTSNLTAQSIFKVEGDVSFVSIAPLETIEGNTNELIGIVDISNKNFAFKVNVASFDGFNSPLQKEHFNEHYLETEKFPEATFLGTMLIKDDCTNGCVTDAICKGKFTIHGVTQIVTIPINYNFEESKLKINGEFKVKLSEYNIKIPKIVQAKIASEVIVKLNILLSNDI